MSEKRLLAEISALLGVAEPVTNKRARGFAGAHKPPELFSASLDLPPSVQSRRRLEGGGICRFGRGGRSAGPACQGPAAAGSNSC